MLNFAEQTGSGAVIVVWSFLQELNRVEYFNPIIKLLARWLMSRFTIGMWWVVTSGDVEHSFMTCKVCIVGKSERKTTQQVASLTSWWHAVAFRQMCWLGWADASAAFSDPWHWFLWWCLRLCLLLQQLQYQQALRPRKAVATRVCHLYRLMLYRMPHAEPLIPALSTLMCEGTLTLFYQSVVAAMEIGGGNFHGGKNRLRKSTERPCKIKYRC